MNERAITAGLMLAALCGHAAFAQTPPSTAVKGFVVDQTGNLGVGTSAPQSTLDVAGDALVEGVLTGGGLSGRFGSAAVINGFDNRYGKRSFVLTFNNGASTPQTAIQIQAVDPVNPSQSVFKTFIIEHPQGGGRYLVHAALEGPEGAVFYRGSARLAHGRALVRLPVYFESLTRKEGRTIQLTDIDGFDVLAVRTRAGAKILNGAFLVTTQNLRSAQRFDWEVKAVRADVPPLKVEPRHEEIAVKGFGPYTYAAPPEPAPAAAR